jgi:hypothetical protein
MIMIYPDGFEHGLMHQYLAFNHQEVGFSQRTCGFESYNLTWLGNRHTKM